MVLNYLSTAKKTCEFGMENFESGKLNIELCIQKLEHLVLQRKCKSLAYRNSCFVKKSSKENRIFLQRKVEFNKET